MKFGTIDILFFVGMILIMYFLIFLPKKKEANAVKKMMEGLKKGDRVLTHAGMYGEVQAIKETIVTLKVGDNTRIDFNKSAIARIIDDKEKAEESKA